MLVTDSEELAEAVAGGPRRAGRRDEALRAGRARPSTGTQSRIVLVDDLDAGLDVVNAYAAEHLEIQTRDAAASPPGSATPARSSSAPHAPVSLGDYAAGSNHVLPTGGCACHSSGLSVQSFLRGIHVVDYAEAALREVAHHVVTLAAGRGPARARRGGPARFGGERGP